MIFVGGLVESDWYFESSSLGGPVREASTNWTMTTQLSCLYSTARLAVQGTPSTGTRNRRDSVGIVSVSKV